MSGFGKRLAASSAVSFANFTRVSAGVIALISVVVAVVAVGAIVAVARLRAWDPASAARWRHAWHEAGYRLGGAWSEFVDWLRSA
jgi:hypothetical protein